MNGSPSFRGKLGDVLWGNLGHVGKPHEGVLAGRLASVARHLGEEAFDLQLQAPSDYNGVRCSKRPPG